MNELSGSQWLYWTNTIFETNFPPDPTHLHRKSHGAMKPPELMAEIISFFSKPGEVILDPFAGVGGTLLGAELVDREALGIEINPLWVNIYEEMTRMFVKEDGSFVKISGNNPQPGQRLNSKMILGDCLEVLKNLADGSMAAIITDPPYGCQNTGIAFKKETNFHMKSNNEKDFGNCPSYHDYLQKMKLFGAEAYRILIPGRYLVMLVGDRFYRGEYLPLGVLVALALREVGFKWKGLRIWWNKATQRPLKPYAVKSCFVPNINHQNLLILRKETKNNC
ncbi:MAG: DNA methyltransferase [Bacillota bacterium]